MGPEFPTAAAANQGRTGRPDAERRTSLPFQECLPGRRNGMAGGTARPTPLFERIERKGRLATPSPRQPPGKGAPFGRERPSSVSCFAARRKERQGRRVWRRTDSGRRKGGLPAGKKSRLGVAHTKAATAKPSFPDARPCKGGKDASTVRRTAWPSFFLVFLWKKPAFAGGVSKGAAPWPVSP